MTSLLPYGGIGSPRVISILVLGWPSTFQTPDWGHFCPVIAVIAVLSFGNHPWTQTCCERSGTKVIFSDAGFQGRAVTRQARSGSLVPLSIFLIAPEEEWNSAG